MFDNGNEAVGGGGVSKVRWEAQSTDTLGADTDRKDQMGEKFG